MKIHDIVYLGSLVTDSLVIIVQINSNKNI